MNLHTASIDLIKGRRAFDEEELSYLDTALQYRMDAMHQAQAFVEYLELSFSSNITLDVQVWCMQFAKNYDSPDPQIVAGARQKRVRYDKVHNYVCQLKLFPRTSPQQGPGYTKPNSYLAIALFEENLSWRDTEIKLRKLQTCKLLIDPY
jgi:hypothetical protein